jgi:hypothetical protein
MPTESKTLTEQRIRKERALATMRELQLHQLEGSLPSADQVERASSALLNRSTRCTTQMIYALRLCMGVHGVMPFRCKTRSREVVPSIRDRRRRSARTTELDVIVNLLR